jgi:ribulose-5-phosphate 4-epimerase/fuculose-1-phosphate aldolase
MSEQTRLREKICRLAKSMFDRGLTSGASGNISVKLDDGSLIVTPTGSSFGTLDPEQLSHFNNIGQQISGAAPTKEMPLHRDRKSTRLNSSH